MDYWAKYIYSWGNFRQKSIHPAQLQFKERFGCREFPVCFSDEAHFLLSGDVNSKNNIFWGSTPREHCLQRPLHSAKCTAWVAISKHGIIGPFWFEDDNERPVTINTERYVQVLGKFWTALGRRRGVVRVLISYRCDPQWSPHYRIEPPRFLYVGMPYGQGVWQQPPDYPWLEGSNHSSNESDPKGGMRESHRKLCPPDPKVPGAAGSSFGAHFLSASETKSLSRTDLKLWRCPVTQAWPNVAEVLCKSK